MRRKYWTQNPVLVAVEALIKFFVVVTCVCLSFALVRMGSGAYGGWYFTLPAYMGIGIWESASALTHEQGRLRPSTFWYAFFLLLLLLLLFQHPASSVIPLCGLFLVWACTCIFASVKASRLALTREDDRGRVRLRRKHVGVVVIVVAFVSVALAVWLPTLWSNYVVLRWHEEQLEPGLVLKGTVFRWGEYEGIRHGIHLEVDDGVVTGRGRFHYGVKDGWWTCYDTDGAITLQRLYDGPGDLERLGLSVYYMPEIYRHLDERSEPPWAPVD